MSKIISSTEVDGSCDCSACTSRTTEKYELPYVCFNCGQRFTAKFRKGDRTYDVQCPNCQTRQTAPAVK